MFLLASQLSSKLAALRGKEAVMLNACVSMAGMWGFHGGAWGVTDGGVHPGGRGGWGSHLGLDGEEAENAALGQCVHGLLAQTQVGNLQ